MSALGRLTEYSEPALQSALRVAGAGLDRLPIELTGTNDLSRPTWASGSAAVDAGSCASSRAPSRRLSGSGTRLACSLCSQTCRRSTCPKLSPPVRTPRAWPLGSLRVGCRSPRTSSGHRCPSGSMRSAPNWPGTSRSCTPPNPSPRPRAARRPDPQPGARTTSHDRRAEAALHANDRGSPARACTPMVRLGRRAAGSPRRAGVRSRGLPPLEPALGPARAPPAPRRRLRNERHRRARVRLSVHSQLRAWGRSADLNR